MKKKSSYAYIIQTIAQVFFLKLTIILQNTTEIFTNTSLFMTEYYKEVYLRIKSY